MKNKLLDCLSLACLLSLMPMAALAAELSLTLGGGQRVNSAQGNQTLGVDYSFFEHRRSERQTIDVGVSYTYMRTDAGSGDEMYAISIYPQLTLHPKAGGWIHERLPEAMSAFFFVRALGPSYLSNRKLGRREQSEHFGFQAQVGVGMRFTLGSERRGAVSLSWKHFSNANLFPENESFDFPIVLSLGLRL